MHQEDDLAGQARKLASAAREVIAACQTPDFGEPSDPPVVKVAVSTFDRFPSVSISRDWQKAVQPTELDAVVNRAITQFLRSEAPSGDSEPEVPSWQPDFTGRFLFTAMEHLNKVTEDAMARLSQAITQFGVNADPVASNRSGGVKVYAQGGQLQRIEINAAWAAGKTGATISNELNTALRDAANAEPAQTLDPLSDPRAIFDYVKDML